MSSSGPLRFQPLFRRYLWGGRRLETLLGKSLPPGDDYAESWELVDHGADQSRVLAGPDAGVPFGALLQSQGREWLGEGVAAGARFPLLFKFLDAHQALSVQVHPDDERAARQPQPDLGKTEAWVILHADPGAVLYAGLKRGFDRRALEREVNRGTTHLCLHRCEPRAGDCYFIPAGTVHALGAGLVVAEIQQSSDSTYRLFDWNRVGPDGQPRPLHIAQALDAIDYQRGPIAPQIPAPTDTAGLERLVACDQFIIDRGRFEQPVELPTRGRFQVLMVLNGAVEVDGDPAGRPLVRGQTMFIPACLKAVRLTPVGGVVELLVCRTPVR
ncbi:MAG: type I phosphomannose isomerase catalytic subunit [Pirellulales bacterium]